MNQEVTQCLGYKLSNDPETEGFDLQAGQTWIYPTNYPIRDYQFNIIQEALLKNTLVSLPTGLGKTFIAAVLMYNFFRWYPLGKVIFMAPTRPLVKQQIDACYDIMAIPKDVTAELTGSKMANCREDIWNDKRVFFITPQILQNDLEKVSGLGAKIKCLVFDEAHRARGNHAYCEVIRKLIVHNKSFRVLALSATPGSNIGDVSEVVQNLLISHLEFRTEESVDVQPYVHERNLTTIVVPLGKMLQKVKDDYLQILEYYTKTLVKYKVIQGNCGNLTKGKIFLTMREFQQTRNNGSSNYAEIMKSLNLCVTLYHGFELLIRHGLRSFLSFFSEHIDKPLLRGNTRLMEIMNDIREYLGPEPNIEQLPDGSYPEIPETTKFGHPKFYKLRDILLSHFTQASESSRVIVFFEYRNSVMEAYALLFQARPILKPRIFLGQRHGVTQRIQLNVVKSFREGDCNILLSTCIGEEGLDVGDVDLIICFDISNKSPIRMVQRMGRTGRTKKGNIIVLVTEGKEQQVLKDCLIHKNNIPFHVLSSRELANGLNYSSPRLVPTEVTPKCEKIYITVKKPQLTKNSSLKDMFRNISSSSSEPTFSPDLQIVDVEEKIPKSQTLWNKVNPLNKEFAIANIFSKRIEKQRSLQPIHLVKHSESSKILVNLLQLIDSKRFNIPISQIGSSSQLTQNRNLKQCDIRNMFLKSMTSNDVVPGTQGQKITPARNTQKEENHLFDSKGLITEMSNYLSIRVSVIKRCRHCPNNIDCSMNNICLQYTPFSWNQVNDSVLNTITAEDLDFFSQSLDPNSEESCNEFEFKDFDVFHNLKITQLEKISKLNNSSDLDSEQQGEYFNDEDVYTDVPLGEKSVAYQAPKTLDSLLSKYSRSIIDVAEISQRKDEENNSDMNPNTLNNSEKVNNEHKSIEDEILHFFNCNSLTELFNCENIINESQETIIYSPDIFDNTIMKKNESISTEYKENNHKGSEDELSSPVLCTFERVRNVKQFQKNIFDESFKKDTCREKQINISKSRTTHTRPNLQNLLKRKETNNEVDTPSKFTMDITKLSSTPIEKIGRNNAKSYSNENCVSTSNLHKKIVTDGNHIQANELNSTKEKDIINNLDVDDLCDLSIFGLSDAKESRVSSNSEEYCGQSKNKKNALKNQTSNRHFSSNFDIDDFCDLTTFIMGNQNKNDDKTENEVTENVTIISDSKMIHSKHVITRLDNLVDKQNRGTVHVRSNDSDEIIIDSSSSTKENYCMPPNKSYSQSQLPITQLLSLINKDEKKISKDVQATALQRNNFELNANCILNNDFLNYEDRSSRDRGKDLLIKDTFHIKDISPKTSRLALPTNQKKEKQSLRISLHKSFSSTNSDDDFEEKQHHAYEKQKSQMYNKNRNQKLKTENANRPKMVKEKKNCNIFIDDEAELSVNEDVQISEDEEDHDQDMYEISFIADETQNVDTQMHARYLQSVRSPRKGQFKIPPRKIFQGNVYSQEVDHENDTYLDDTFVVHEETESPQFELSELEILEQKLKKIKRNKRKKSEDITKPVKRRRIIHISSDDSD